MRCRIKVQPASGLPKLVVTVPRWSLQENDAALLPFASPFLKVSSFRGFPNSFPFPPARDPGHSPTYRVFPPVTLLCGPPNMVWFKVGSST